METKKPRILLIDDDVVMQNMYSEKFTKAGYDFHELANADGDIIKKVSDIKPELIMMDIHFEGSHVNGVDASEELQKAEQTKHIPIIFFTNGDIEELAERAKKINTSIGFMVKADFVPSEVVTKVQELYNNSVVS